MTVHKFIEDSIVLGGNDIMKLMDINSYDNKFKVIRVDNERKILIVEHLETGQRSAELFGFWETSFNPYLPPDKDVNTEIKYLLDLHKFKSFSGVTLDGKVIQIDKSY